MKSKIQDIVPDFSTRVALFHSSSGIDKGDITLSEPFTNFRYLYAVGANDNKTYVTQNLHMTDIMKGALELSNGYNILSGNVYWSIAPFKSGTTTTYLKQIIENCVIHSIYGLNRK